MLVIGIAGGTGSWKTTVARKIIERLPRDEVAVLPQDAYYKDIRHLSLEVRQKMNFDYQDSVEFDLLIKDLKELKKNKEVEQPIYSHQVLFAFQRNYTSSAMVIVEEY